MLYRLLLALLLLLPMGALAQDETLSPDSDEEDSTWLNEAGTACNAVACDDDVDEDSTAPDDNEVRTGTDAAEIFFGFPTPSSNPSTTASAQVFVAVMDRSNAAGSTCAATGGSTPTYDIEVYCNGSLDQVIATAVAIASASQLTNHSWTFSDTNCATDGSDVQVNIQSHEVGAGGGERRACIDTLEWEVTHVSVGRSRRFLSLKGLMRLPGK